MKKLSLSLFFQLFTVAVMAQQYDDVLYSGQLVEQFFHDVQAQSKMKAPSRQEVLNAQARPLPANFSKILQENNWIDIVTVHFGNGTYEKTAEKSCCQIRFDRYDSKGRRYRLEAQRDINRDGSLNWAKLLAKYQYERAKPVEIVKINGKNFFKTKKVTSGSEGYDQIISYQNGLLIYDATRNGTIAEVNSSMRYRMVAMAIPKSKYDFGNTDPQLSFPILNYPMSTGSSTGNCSQAVSESQFTQLAENVYEIYFEDERIAKLNALLQQHCFTTTQIMRLSTLIVFRPKRLEFLKKAYHRCYDAQNYTAAPEALESQFDKQEKLKNELVQYINQNPAKPPNNTVQNTNPLASNNTCIAISESKFEQVYNAVKIKNFEKERYERAEELLTQYKCFSTMQIRKMTDLFAFNETKLKFLIQAYNYTSDKQNYRGLSDLLSLKRDKERLINVIKTHIPHPYSIL